MEKAYENQEFLASREARTLRILSEYLEPQARFARYRIKDTIVFFGSARAIAPEALPAAIAEAEAIGTPAVLAAAKAAARLSRYYDGARELAHKVTDWSKSLQLPNRRFIVCSGGGPGIMEAANRGASEAHGISIGLGISLPMEPAANPYITRELGFEFHYFFMRKFWFVYLAKALVVFPGGFGTLDELFELLTLLQTGKIRKRMPIVLFGNDYWNQVMNLDTMVKYGTIDARDLDLMFRTDSVDEAFDYLVKELTQYALPNPGAKL